MNTTQTLERRTKRPKAKKATQISILRSYGIPGPISLRYKNPLEKGIYWYLFSLAIRTRDVERYGTCVSCGRVITVETCDAGHFIPAASCGPKLLFDPLNVNAECSRCNAWDDLHLLGYAKTLNARYGEHTAEILLQTYRERRHQGLAEKDFTKKEYQHKLEKLIKTGL